MKKYVIALLVSCLLTSVHANEQGGSTAMSNASGLLAGGSALVVGGSLSAVAAVGMATVAGVQMVGEVALRDRAVVQAWLRQAGFAPIPLTIPASTRLGARMFKANISFDDHPFARRMAGQIDTVTVESVLRFAQQRDGALRKLLVKAD